MTATAAPTIAAPVATARPAADRHALDASERLARWLLLAVLADLVLTRLVVRLAIFIPKGEPWASLSAVLGRAGAVADALVPIVGLLVLVALLGRAGRRGPLERSLVLGVAVVSLAGLALVVLPATPVAVLLVDGLIVLVALGAGWSAIAGRADPFPAGLGLLALAVSVALAALARAVGTLPVAVGLPEAGEVGASLSPWVVAVGQLAYVGGAALVGAAGIRVAIGERASPGGLARLAVGGLVVAVAVAVAAARSPAYWGAVAIWSLGLSGAVPALLVALGLGLAVAGLPPLRRVAPSTALGAAIVLAAGSGLAASGLIMAGLIGLLVARDGSAAPLERRPT